MTIDSTRFDNALWEACHLVIWYIQEHLLLTMIPAFFIAGAIATFVSKDAVIKCLGENANKVIAYSAAAISGTILTVCSCTILPLFASIHRNGAGIGPACTFLYSGPAINVLAIIMTARILGTELGIARAVGAICLSIFIGLCMASIFRKEGHEKAISLKTLHDDEVKHPVWDNVLLFAALLGILIFISFGCAGGEGDCPKRAMYSMLASVCGITLGVILVMLYNMKWWKAATVAVPTATLAYLFPGSVLIPFAAAVLGLSIITGTDKGECGQWFAASWDSAKKIIPILLFGIFIAGLLLGRVGEEGLIPSDWVVWAVGGNSMKAYFFAAVAGTLMYFSTCVEVPIIQGLIGAGMGKGPALTLLLSGPAMSLPSLLIINSILGFRKTFVFMGLVVISSMLCGMVFGHI